jgi:hypothetical protein
MKVSCIKCGDELEANYGLNLKKCKGEFILLQITCLNCNTLNEVRRVLGEKADTKKVEDFIKKQNYIG